MMSLMRNILCDIKIYKMKILGLIFILLFPALCYSQDTLITESDTIITNTGIIEVDQVEVIKAFEAKLIDAKKISLKPQIKPIVTVDKSYDYDITIVPLKIDYPEPVIKPLAMNPDLEKPIKRFYSRIGYGNLKSPYADLSYHHQRGDEFDYTISGHFYGADDSDKVKFRKFYESELNLNGGYRLGENHKLSVDLGGGYDLRNLYDTVVVGSSEMITEEDVKRNIFRVKARIGISNIETSDANFNYRIGIVGQRIKFNGQFESTGTGFGLDFLVDNKVSSILTVFLKGEGAINSLSFSSGSANARKAFTINPGVNFTIGNFRLDAAADLFFDEYQNSPFVDFKASYSLLDNGLQIYVGADQVAIANTLWNHYTINPFVLGDIEIDKTTLSKQFFGGISGKIKDFLTFNFKGGYADIKDQFYYDNGSIFSLQVRHTDMTNIFINANIDFNLSENITLGAILNQNFYTLESIDILPNMPEYKYAAYSKIKLLDGKFVLSTELSLMDKISFIDDNGTNVLGNNQVDLSLGIDFFVTDNIGLWVRANNILDREYLRFNNYPEYGRNILGGLLVKF